MTTMLSSAAHAALDHLATTAAETAMVAAADYLAHVQAARLSSAEIDTLTEILRVEVKSAIHEARREAQVAQAHLSDHVAAATFRASMSLAGIQAAQTFLAGRK